MDRALNIIVFSDIDCSQDIDNIIKNIYIKDLKLNIIVSKNIEELIKSLNNLEILMCIIVSDNSKNCFFILDNIISNNRIIKIIITKNVEPNYIKFIDKGAFDIISSENIDKIPFVIYREIKKNSLRNIPNYFSYSSDEFFDIEKHIDQYSVHSNLLIDDISLLPEILESLDKHLIFVKDAKTFKYLYGNLRYCETFKISQQKLIGKKSSDFLSNELAARIIKEDDELIKTNKELYFIEEYKDKFGNELIFNTKKRLILDTNNQPKYIIGILEDITKKVRIQSELKKSSLRFSKIFHTSPIPIAVNNAVDSVFVDFNQSFLDLVEYEHNELLGKKISDINLWTDNVQRKEMFKEVVTNGSVRNREVKAKTKTGKELTLMISMETVNFEDEYLIITMGLDITKIIRANLELEQSLNKQQQLNMLRTQFISMISHEFRTPLTTIMLSADMLKRYSKNLTEEEKVKHFGRIQETVLRMTQLMENVLIIGKMDSGRFDLNPDNVDLKAFCETIYQNIEFNTGGLYKIIFNYHSEITNTIIDENLFGLIISNLLTNAIKYSPKLSSVDFDIWIDDKEIKLTIRDYGIGIPENDLKNLYSEFFRASNVGNSAGYGLGLAIVKKCIDSCNGRIELESQVGQGTIFTVYLPIIEMPTY